MLEAMPDPGQIHLWTLKPSNAPDFELCRQFECLLNFVELARMHRFRFDRDKKRHLLTRTLLRSVLSHYFPKTDKTKWQFEINKYGKPSISNSLPWPLKFNISHSGDLILIAVANGNDVGVDVETIASREKTAGLIERCFSSREASFINYPSVEQTEQRFFQLWTLKESYIKALGTGLSTPLKSFEFEINEGRAELRNQADGDKKKWLFWMDNPDKLHQIALCLERVSPRPLEVQYRPLSYTELASMVDSAPDSSSTSR